jgi:hypothetical protein
MHRRPARPPQDWRQGLPGFLQFPGDVRLGSSLVDGRPSWLIDYSSAPMFVGHDFRDFFDEMREVRGWLRGVPASEVEQGRLDSAACCMRLAGGCTSRLTEG